MAIDGYSMLYIYDFPPFAGQVTPTGRGPQVMFVGLYWFVTSSDQFDIPIDLGHIKSNWTVINQLTYNKSAINSHVWWLYIIYPHLCIDSFHFNN